LLRQPLQAGAPQREACLQTLGTPGAVDTPPPAPARTRRARQRHAPGVAVHGSRAVLTGGALTQLDGMEALPALQVLRESGLARTPGPPGQPWASWWGWWPGHKLLGGNRARLRRQPTAKRAASAVGRAAQGVVQRPSALGAAARRRRARLGAPKALTAPAQTRARLVDSRLR
jgi:transposase